ncbi:MAG TPA: hypothetical protein VGR03_01705 [Candidatus Acidoferrum sp.]|nr:hypothetical protein [Candidatus Acidoferrum sp.]
MSKATADLPTSWSLHWLGAARTSVVIPMETGKYYEVQLTNHGAPPDAKILTVDCAPQGGEGGYLTALEWHPNSSGRSVGTVVRLIAVCLTEEPVASTRRVLVSVVWIRGEESDAWPYLVTAFGAAAAQEFAPSMVFAQSAVEISMMPLIEQRLRRHVAANRVENFMKDSLTYSHALNVVLPYLIAELGGPKLPEPIRGQLNSLRKKRNAIIHQGVKAAAVSREDAMKGLCAAAFGFEYMRHVGPILSESHR